MTVAAHEFVEGFCKWCGAMPPGTNSTCLERPVVRSTLRPEPARRQFASEDYDTIGARLAELAQQRQDILNTPEETMTHAAQEVHLATEDMA